MHKIDTEGIESLHIWVIVEYNPIRWIGKPVLMEHYNFGENFSYLKENYIIPIRGNKVKGSPADRLAMLLLILKQRSVKCDDKFYLLECEIPINFVGESDNVVMPYVAMDWVRSINELEKISSNKNYFKYSCEVLYEDEYRSLLFGTKYLEYNADSLQPVLNRVNTLTDPQIAYNYSVSSMDMLKSIMVRCSDFSNDSQEYLTLYDFIRSDICSGEFNAFRGRHKELIDNHVLKSYQYLWELYKQREYKEERDYSIDFDNTPEYIKNANKVLDERRKQEERKKEKERIRKEKEEIARKKKYYGPNADRVDDRVKQNQNSIGWWARWLANKVTFGRVRPPKTLRSDDYREKFIKKNPGIFVNGLYFCIYCGKPIRAKAQDKNKKMYVDHIKPINQGGRNSTWNLGPACWKCNSEKSDKAGEWVLNGYLGKIGFTLLQTVSSVSKTLLFGFKERNWIKKGVSVAFYGYTGLWLLRFIF